MDPAPRKPTDETTPIHLHAMDNITYIRDAMERSATFTAVPGWGMVIVGGLATLGSYVATLRLNETWWFNVWITIGLISMLIGIVALRVKANRMGTEVFSASGRRFLSCFAPAIIAGMVLTDMFYRDGASNLVVPMWLMLYGIAVLAGGVYSIPVVQTLGVFLLLLGFFASQMYGFERIGLLNFNVDDVFMVTGFGFAHIVVGLIIAMRHGG